MDTDGGMKNCFNNPAYYVLEGVPHQLLTENPLTLAKPPVAKNKVPITVPVQLEKRCPPLSSHPSTRGEESSSDDDVGTMNLPPPDFPPPPLPKTVEFEMVENPFYASSKEVQALATPKAAIGKDQTDVRTGVTKPKAGVAFCEPLESKLPSKPHPVPAQSSAPRVGVTFATEHQSSTRKAQGAVDDHSFSVLQMARTLSEVDNCDSRSGPTGRGQHGRTHLPPERGPTELPLRGYHSDYSQPITFPSRCIRESIKEDQDEEGMYQSERSSSSLSESGVGDWLRAIGMERYEAGLLHNGWDDLEFLSDITQEDLQEAGVQDPAHRKVILENLKLLRK